MIQLKNDELNNLVKINSDGAYLYTYSKTDDSGYAINGTLVLRQPVLCSYFDNSSPSDGPHLNQSYDTININISSGNTVFTYTDASNVSKFISNNYSVKYNTTLMTTESGTYTFILKWDDSCKLTFNETQKIVLTSSVERVAKANVNFKANLVANTYYPTLIEFDKYTGNSKLQLYWIRPGRSTEEIVPQENLWFDHYYDAHELDVTCPTKYTKRSLQNNQSSNETWGDGHRIGYEQWDDSNTENGDGCSSEWVVEKGYICTGGSNTTSDEWKRCPVGYKHFRYFENTGYVKCIPESDAYNIIFYIIIVVLVIGMIKHVIYNFFMYVNEIDEQNNSELQENKNLLKVQNNRSLGEVDKDQDESQKHTNQNENNKIDIKIHADGEEEDKDENKKDTKNIEFHRLVNHCF